MNPPLIYGGQGRDPDEHKAAAVVMFVAFCTFVAGAALAWIYA